MRRPMAVASPLARVDEAAVALILEVHPATVLQFAASCSAPRSDSAKMV
jgi:hypothetical protein